ncbi:tigger transposable element-derived protein 6-like [Bactrocera neohumeralis]|uniref:tigger transposable element-derived protein 6-like n=1 Tax=Bactrocera neohumeralis TaxID=98809 RepID=UPI002166320C|nr:tigger transposable element-derived protein 6-like [Bactrocera neohumeralis]
MTSELFEKWLHDWDRDLVKKKKNILMLIDNCSAHPNVTDLKSITLAFLPPNTTSVLQPTDQGIIRSLKTNFRKNLVLKMFNCLEANENNSSTKNNGARSNSDGFIESHDGLPIQISEHEFDEEDDIPLSLWSRNLNSDSLTAPEMWEDYVDVYSATTDENIVQNISAKKQLESDGEEEVEEEPLPTAEEALKAAELLSRFVHSNIENDNLTIAMSSIHNRFIESHDGLPIQISEHEFDEEDDIPLSLWSRNLNSDSLTAPEMWEDYVDVYSATTDENIVQNISAKKQLESDGEEEVEEEPLKLDFTYADKRPADSDKVTGPKMQRIDTLNQEKISEATYNQEAKDDAEDLEEEQLNFLGGSPYSRGLSEE